MAVALEAGPTVEMELIVEEGLDSAGNVPTENGSSPRSQMPSRVRCRQPGGLDSCLELGGRVDWSCWLF